MAHGMAVRRRSQLPWGLGAWGSFGDLELTMGYIIRVVRKGANETHLGVCCCCCWPWLLFVCDPMHAWMLCFALLCFVFKPFFFGILSPDYTAKCPFGNNNDNNNNTYLIIVISLYFPTNLLPLTHFFFLSVHLFHNPLFWLWHHNISHFFDSWLLLLLPK